MAQPHPHPQRPPQIQIGPFSPEKKHSDPERWICIYPAYLNSMKSRSEGRLINKSKCVPNPTYVEIREVLTNAEVGWMPVIENKQYPRERSREIEFRGRIRVQLRKDDGSFLSNQFKSREDILSYIGEKIPQLKSRQTKQNPQSNEQVQSSGANTKKGKRKK